MPDTNEYAATFAFVDADSDGRITAQEYADLMHRMGDSCTEEQAQRAIEAMDRDGDGLITLEEFALYMADNGD
ncbi:calcium-binding protein [Nocardiopsis sp. CNR-923]|uniref:EF-hand domain-containing protein n=1 Tax=Nocardiopsis sp. CNR-923 TaxID=1904965 RepID=UPI00095C20D6|nr:EF-hand domain-containing protein [Nocardiopsis sp. CNR-923]OLT27107.1 calcium-binding protein [Nocardiopsis sp. CNR-923]